MKNQVLRTLWCGIFLVVSLPVLAQPTTEGQRAIQQVFEALTGKNVRVRNIFENLQRGPWEALAYIEEGENLTADDLQEAVPDYYRFEKDVVAVKLINPDNHNEYGMEIEAGYRVTAEREIELIDKASGQVRERWKILYLDENYLALDMGEIRLFFTHTTSQE